MEHQDYTLVICPNCGNTYKVSAIFDKDGHRLLNLVPSLSYSEADLGKLKVNRIPKLRQQVQYDYDIYNDEAEDFFGPEGHHVECEPEQEHDPVNHPSHYDKGGMECIDWISKKLTHSEMQGYLKGNILKYLYRYEDKDNPIQDLQKARWYLDRLIKDVAMESEVTSNG